jgi:hypothetical protein
MAWFRKKEKEKKRPAGLDKLDGKLVAYAVRREPNGEVVIGKNGRICAATEVLELRFEDGSVPFACPVETLEFGELLSKNGVLLTGDDTVTGRRLTAVAYYSYYRK